MAQFLKINYTNNLGPGAYKETSLLNLSDINIIDVNGSTAGGIFYGNLTAIGGYIGLVYDPPTPVGPEPSTLLGVFEQTIQSNPSARVIPLGIGISSRIVNFVYAVN